MKRLTALLALLVALLPALALATPSCVLNGTASASGSQATVTATATSVSHPDSLLIFVASEGQNLSSVTLTVTDSDSQTINGNVSWGHYGSETFWLGSLDDATAGSHTITATLGTAESGWTVHIAECSGLNPSGSFYQAGTAGTGTGTSWTATSPTPTSGMLAYAFFAAGANSTSWGSPFTSINVGGAYPSAYAVTGSSAVTATVTGGSASWGGVVALYNAAGAPTGPPKSQFFFAANRPNARRDP